jgi:hypothetical protein
MILPKTACAFASGVHNSAAKNRALKLSAFFIEFPPTIGKPVECLTTELEVCGELLLIGKQFQFRTFSSLHVLQ